MRHRRFFIRQYHRWQQPGILIFPYFRIMSPEFGHDVGFKFVACVFEEADIFLAQGSNPGFDAAVEGGYEGLGGLFGFAEVFGYFGGFARARYWRWWDWRAGRKEGLG